ncbi:DUF3196 family protein [Spiroplasma endosymbiont of Crioceris asparagi]|uniref:DUF3196 family protein n=1 Tax=Spiroplasma endosymbiont of Crioceris asparagi TaxID=3066286 RepID=UPI0030D32406
MAKNYYEEILEEIEELISEAKFDEALDLLNVELKMPYIPKDIEVKMMKLFKEVAILKQEKISQELKSNWSLEKVNKIINDQKKVDLHVIAFSKLRDFNAKKILDSLITYLKNYNNPDEAKTFLFLVLAEQELDHVFEFKKANTTFKLNPKNIDINKYNEKNKIVKKLIEEALQHKEPVLASLSLQLFNQFTFCLFPEEIDEADASNIAFKVIKECAKMMNIDLLTYNMNIKVNEDKQRYFDKLFEEMGITN